MAKRSGFTLLELVIVLICIAIVIAVLFPVFASRPRERSGPSCLSLVKQMGLAAIQYAVDYDEAFPTSGFPAIKIKGEPSSMLPLQVEKPADAWYETMYPYIKNHQRYYCPSDESKQQTNYPAPAQSDEYATSYTMNRWVTLQPKLENLADPAKFILLAERNNATQPPNGSYLFAPWEWRKDAEAAGMGQDLALTRHSEGSMVGFSDGHSKWRNVKQMSEARESGSFRP